MPYMTRAEENYLKALFHLSNQDDSLVGTSELADRLDTKPSSATDMLQKLHERELVEYTKYKGAKLSPKGRQTATQVVRKHRLWEVFLVEKLAFGWEEVHEIAEQLEHIKSPELVKRLDEFLGCPTMDPHGDPIPDQQGNIVTIQKTLLADQFKDSSAIVMGIKDSDSEFLSYLSQKNIKLGSCITVLEKEPFDQSMTIEVDGNMYFISKTISNNIYVQTL